MSDQNKPTVDDRSNQKKPQMPSSDANNKHASKKQGTGRRDFLVIATTSAATVGAGAFGAMLVRNMRPADDVLAFSIEEFSGLNKIPEGSGITITWRKLPVFIRHRTAKEIEEAEKTSLAALPDPQEDSERVKNPKWLIVQGNCTHLGCVPKGNSPTDARGDFGGWYCPCHGSHYDTSGRIRKGPAPKNLLVPDYYFLDDNTVVIGEEKVVAGEKA